MIKIIDHQRTVSVPRGGVDEEVGGMGGGVFWSAATVRGEFLRLFNLSQDQITPIPITTTQTNRQKTTGLIMHSIF